MIIKLEKNIYSYIAKYGSVIQIGGDDDKEKRYIALDNTYSVDTITEEEANTLSIFPRIVGEYNSKNIEIKKWKIWILYST